MGKRTGRKFSGLRAVKSSVAESPSLLHRVIAATFRHARAKRELERAMCRPTAESRKAITDFFASLDRFDGAMAKAGARASRARGGTPWIGLAAYRRARGKVGAVPMRFGDVVKSLRRLGMLAPGAGVYANVPRCLDKVALPVGREWRLLRRFVRTSK
jgi:hypothetical protein